MAKEYNGHGTKRVTLVNGVNKVLTIMYNHYGGCKIQAESKGVTYTQNCAYLDDKYGCINDRKCCRRNLQYIFIDSTCLKHNLFEKLTRLYAIREEAKAGISDRYVIFSKSIVNNLKTKEEELKELSEIDTLYESIRLTYYTLGVMLNTAFPDINVYVGFGDNIMKSLFKLIEKGIPLDEIQREVSRRMEEIKPETVTSQEEGKEGTKD